MQRILTVCTGNICRSPIAQVLLAQQLPGFTVRSAGLGARVDWPADPQVLELAAEQGIDLTGHRARQLTEAICRQAELILVMDQSQKNQIEHLFPQVRGKTYRIGHHGGFDVTDPYRKPRQAFEAAWAHIARGVSEWAPRIRELGAAPATTPRKSA